MASSSSWDNGGANQTVLEDFKVVVATPTKSRSAWHAHGPMKPLPSPALGEASSCDSPSSFFDGFHCTLGQGFLTSWAQLWSSPHLLLLSPNKSCTPSSIQGFFTCLTCSTCHLSAVPRQTSSLPCRSRNSRENHLERPCLYSSDDATAQRFVCNSSFKANVMLF